jgi:hypothetical protein
MPFNAAYPSGFNTFVPSFDATGKLVVSFSRNPKSFMINQYTTLTPVKRSVGFFLNITAEEAARVLQSDASDYAWPPGNDAPDGKWGTESNNFLSYTAKRYAFPFRLDYKAVDQADWNIIAAHAAIKAQEAMTARTLIALTALLNTANYPVTHVATFKSLGDNATFASGGTIANPVIRKALLNAAETIQIDTLGKVRPGDLCVVCSPDAARQMSSSAEISNYLSNSPFALAQVRGDSPSQNGSWGLPDLLYAFKMVIEDAVRVSSAKQAANPSRAYVLTNNTALLLARPGELVGFEGSPSFSTGHFFMYEEMTVEQRDDPDNRRIIGRVVEDYDFQVAAPASGFVITNLFS